MSHTSSPDLQDNNILVVPDRIGHKDSFLNRREDISNHSGNRPNTLSCFKERFLEKSGSAEAGFAVGHYEIGEFFTCVEFDGQPG